MTQIERIRKANELLDSVYREMLEGEFEYGVEQDVVYVQVTMNRIKFKIDEKNEEDDNA